MQQSTAGDLDLDLKSPPNVQDPFPVHRYLRDREPVRWNESLNAWTIARYDDVLEVFNRPARFSSDRFRRLDPRYASERPEVKAVADVLADWLVFRDPPDHTRLRGLLQKSFTPRHLEKNRDRIQTTIDELLGAAAGRGEMDFIRDFAFPLPALTSKRLPVAGMPMNSPWWVPEKRARVITLLPSWSISWMSARKSGNALRIRVR